MTKLTESAIETYAIELFDKLGYSYLRGIQRGRMQCAPTIGHIVNLLQGGTNA